MAASKFSEHAMTIVSGIPRKIMPLRFCALFLTVIRCV